MTTEQLDAIVGRVLDACDDYFLAVDDPKGHRDAAGGRANLVDAIGRVADGLERIADAVEQTVKTDA